MTPENFGQEIFISRELSWLDFNSRVLDEAGCKANPLLERLKFIAIFSSNLDEFFMVRIAGLRQLIKIKIETPDPAGQTPGKKLKLIHRKVEGLLKRQYRYLYQDILPELEQHNIRLRKPSELPQNAKNELKKFFHSQIFPVLTPVAVDPSHPFPMLHNGSIEIAVSMIPEGKKETVYAFVEVPEVLPRFLIARDGQPGSTYVLLEDLIMDNLQSLFVDCKIREYFPFRITRDMDFSVEDEDSVADLLVSIEKKLLQRRRREPIRLEILKGCRGKLATWLQKQFKLDSHFKYSGQEAFHLKQFFELAGKEACEELLEKNWEPVKCPRIDENEPVFKSISANGPICLALPFHAFDPVVRMLEEAAEDPAVLAIKQTLYRVSGNSPVVKALQRAAENGKQVTVIVELKARFDEENNILWAKRLEDSGAHVIYGISGLKIHCKALLIVRKEEGIIRRYVHVSTGNYNDKTAKLYTDIGIFSSDQGLCSDISMLFNIMTGYSAPRSEWNRIAVAPFDLRKKTISLIDREARLSTPDNPGHIIAKMNSLVDPEIIRHLYAAAHANVKIDLIVRGICCLKPGVGTENINVISIVDRYLEHSRILFFKNGGMQEYYLTSADWMPRNLDRRIELLFPVNDARICEILSNILQLELNDAEKSRTLLNSGNYTRKFLDDHLPSRSQRKTYELFKNMADNADRDMQKHKKLKIFTSTVKV